MERFVPANGILVKYLDMDFENDGQHETVIAYVSDLQTRPTVSTGVRVLKREVAGWTVAFEEKDSVDNGGGSHDAINIRKVKAATGEEAVVVILNFSGAGTATFWHVLTAVNNKIFKLDPTRERAGVLEETPLPGLGIQQCDHNGSVRNRDAARILNKDRALFVLTVQPSRYCSSSPALRSFSIP